MEYLKETPPLGAVDQADVDAFYHNRLTEAGTTPELTFYFPTVSQPTDNSTEFIIPGHVSSGDDDTQRNAFLGSSDLGQYSAFPGNGNLLGQYSAFLAGNGDLVGQNSAFLGNDDLLGYNAFLGNVDARQQNAFPGNDDAQVQPNALGNDDTQVQRGASPANDDTRNLEIDHIIDPISALYIDGQGNIYPIDSSAGENEQTTFTTLHFLGFFSDGRVLPLYTNDVQFLQTTLDRMSICLVGVVRKLPDAWYVRVYTWKNQLDQVKAQLSGIIVRPVFMRSNGGITCGTLVYDLSPDEQSFRPWELGRGRASLVTALEKCPPTVNEASLCSKSDARVKRPRTLSSEAVATLGNAKKVKALTIGALKKDFPSLNVLVKWAKAHYRADCLQVSAYIPSDDRLARADKAFERARVDHPINRDPSPSSRDALLGLIREEHHVFKANSTKYAGEIIHFFYPQDIVISAVQVAEMIETLCSATPTTMSNFLALRNASPAPYSESIKCPLAHAMVGDLLFNLYGQYIKNCGNITLATLIKSTLMTAQSISVETVSYALSLLLDAFINRFRTLLRTLPTETLERIAPRRLTTEVEAFKLRFLHDLWISCEETQMWGEVMRAIREEWLRRILAAIP